MTTFGQEPSWNRCITVLSMLQQHRQRGTTKATMTAPRHSYGCPWTMVGCITSFNSPTTSSYCWVYAVRSQDGTFLSQVVGFRADAGQSYNSFKRKCSRIIHIYVSAFKTWINAIFIICYLHAFRRGITALIIIYKTVEIRTTGLSRSLNLFQKRQHGILWRLTNHHSQPRTSGALPFVATHLSSFATRTELTNNSDKHRHCSQQRGPALYKWDPTLGCDCLCRYRTSFLCSVYGDYAMFGSGVGGGDVACHADRGKTGDCSGYIMP
jgi:hypothetical protein